MPTLAREAGLTAWLTPQRRDGAAALWCRRCGDRALARSRIDGHRPEVSARQAGTQTAGAQKTTPVNGKPGRSQPDDVLFAFLKGR